MTAKDRLWELLTENVKYAPEGEPFVLKVEPIIATLDDQLARTRVRLEFEDKIRKVIRDG